MNVSWKRVCYTSAEISPRRMLAGASLVLTVVLGVACSSGGEVELAGDGLAAGVDGTEGAQTASGGTRSGSGVQTSTGGTSSGTGGQTSASGGVSPGTGSSTGLPPMIEARPGDTRLWKEFVDAKRNGTEPPLPDFSYAGYKYSNEPLPDTSDWPVFRVGDYGAIPDDGKFDDTGIQAAIDAAEARGRGIVLFESGRYKVSPTEGTNNSDRISVEGSNIVLRGRGSASGGTEIFMDKMKLKGFGWPMFVIGAGGEERYVRQVTTLKGTAERETFVIEVADASKLAVGQSISLWTESRELRDDQLGGLAINDEWEQMVESGMPLREHHTIAALDGNKVTLGEPLHITLKEAYDVTVRQIGTTENVGIEEIRFTGNWPSYGEDFIHHKPGDAVHDYGWNCMRWEHVRDGWIDRVEFRNFNQSLSFRATSGITVSNTQFTGKKGHVSVMITQSYGVLVKDSEDTAGHHHGAGVAQRNSGGVYLRYKQDEAQRIDAHGQAPFASLFDNVSGAQLFGNGGSIRHYPHHMNYFVAWNMELEGGPESYDFWVVSRRSSHNFVKPYFVGLHGKAVSLKGSSVAANDSPDERVQPSSLFEAQLALRQLPSYHMCCTEGAERIFDEPVDIAYGTQGKYVFENGVTGSVTFDHARFGDPVPGQRKIVFTRPSSFAH